MPIYDYQCDDCEELFTELVGTHQHYPEPEECKACRSTNFRKLVSFLGRVSLTTFETDADEAVHMEHKRYIEHLARTDQIVEIKEQGPLKYRPEFDKKFH